MSKEEKKDYWSECGQIFFHYGQGYGVTSQLHSIPLGREEDIKRYFKTGEHNDLNPHQQEVLDQIITYRKEEGIGTEDIGATGMERAGDTGLTGDKTRAARPSKARKRLPLRPPRAKSKSVSGR